MDEGRKRVLAIMTAILLAPRLKDWAWDGRGGASTCAPNSAAACQGQCGSYNMARPNAT